MTNGLPTQVVATDPPSGVEPEVVEIPLLLPGWQVDALEKAAHDRGLTAAEMLRHVLREFIETLPGRAGRDA